MKPHHQNINYPIWILFIALMLLVGCGDETSAPNKQYPLLTNGEVALIEKYIERSSTRAQIGQLLMVGIPADFSTIDGPQRKAVNEIIGNLGIGMIMLNTYNYYDNTKDDDSEYISNIINFNNLLQSKTKLSESKLPLLLATDFESSSYTSIKRALTLPPSSLTLSTTQDGPLIESIGQYVGTELANVGIQILLGPVLDTYNVKQGNKFVLQDRCFASTVDGVTRTASHYVLGLHKSGEIVFAKHFPGHGSIESDPHDEIIPVYQGALATLQGELKPYIDSKDGISGIMTSHILVPNLRNDAIATFSPEITELIKQNGLNNKILITDDLSDMGAMKAYMHKFKKTYADVAINAFDAGHDVLLFAHIKNEIKKGKKDTNPNKETNFTIEDLRLVVNQLDVHIESSEQAKLRFKNSLKKILILKAEVARLKSSEPLDRMFKGMAGADSAYHFQSTFNGQTELENTEQAIKKISMPYINDDSSNDTIGNKLVKKAIEESITLVNNKFDSNGVNLDVNLLKLPAEKHVMFVIYEEALSKFKETFTPHFNKNNLFFYTIPYRKQKTDSNGPSPEFSNLERDIFDNFSKADVIVYMARDTSDAALLERLRNKFGKAYSSKVIILCHNSPAIFNHDMVEDSTVVANFSMHPLSFEVDKEILSGAEIHNRTITNIPINIGENGKFYNVSMTKWTSPANQKSFENLFPQDSSFISEKN